MITERVLLVEKSLANQRTPCSVSRVLLGRNVARELLGCAVLLAVGALAACTSITGSSAASNTLSTFNPITSVEIDSSTMFSRLGCGQGPGVPYKYIVTVTALGSTTASNIIVADCFSNAVFENLPAGPSGEADFTLTVDVFDFGTFNKAHPYDINNPSVADQPQIRADAQWRSDCTATQTANIQSLAVCDPLH